MKIALVTPVSANGGRGGAENLYDGLLRALNDAGHEADKVDIVVDESSFEGILEAYCICYFLDLSEYDLVISTKAPTYMVRHRNHVSYLLHTIRVFYDMFEKELGPIDEERLKQRRLIFEFDKYGLDPIRIKKHYVIGETVANRLIDADSFWSRIDFNIVYPAPMISEFRNPEKGEHIFLPGRLHRWKRVNLVIEAMKYVPSAIKLLIAGEGEDKEGLKNFSKKIGVGRKVEFLGKISEDKLLELYSKSIVVPFVPVGEDFGYVTIEAFKSKKPVITCLDSGEASLIVKDGLNGFVVEPDPIKIAEKINYLIENQDDAVEMGEQGYLSVQDITWENVVKRLLDMPQKSTNSESKIKVLVTDNQILDPPIGGGRVRIHELYRNFDPSDFCIYYLGTFDWLGPFERVQNLAKHFTEILVPMTVQQISIDKIFSKLCGGRTTLDVTTPLLLKFTPKYQRKLSDLIRDADVVIVSHPWTFPYVKTEINKLVKRPLLIYDSHNIEYEIKKKILNNGLFGRFLVRNVKNVEKDIVHNCDLIFACSSEDAEGFSKIYGADRNKILVIPNGASVGDIILPSEEERRIMRNRFALGEVPMAIFLASGGYKPNDDAANYICTKLAPLLTDVNFVLVGSVCDTISNKLGAQLTQNVKLMGVVSKEDKWALLCSSDVALNPVTTGSGTNIKVFDYLSAGLSLVTTRVGARGIDFTNYENVVIEELDKFPESIKNIIDNEQLRQKVARGARELAEKYDWKVIAKTAGERIKDLKDDLR